MTADNPQEDRSDKRAEAKAKQEAYVKELARQQREEAEARRRVRDSQAAAKAKAEANAKLAAHLSVLCPMQPSVTHKIDMRVTEGLGTMLRYCGANPHMLQWLSVTPAVARDVMLRAYPLALQLGIMVVPCDRDHTIRFANGSVIDFTWPGKPPIPPPAIARTAAPKGGNLV